MAGQDRRLRSQQLAAYLKEHMIERTTGQCPMGCGRPIPIGGGPLVLHLSRCPGSRKAQRNRRGSQNAR